MSAIENMTKSKITKRMLSYAASYLNVKQVELLDPLVVLFIESLTQEIYKIYNKIDNIESRVLEMISGIITTDISLSAHPSHCILHARTEEPETEISCETKFIIKDKRYLPQGTKQLSFYPVTKTRVYRGGIRYIIHNGMCFSIDSDQTRTCISRSRNTTFCRKNSFWIALELDKEIKSLHNFSFYFDFPRTPEIKEYLGLLTYLKWSINGKPLAVSEGFPEDDSIKDADMTELFRSFEVLSKLNQSVRNYYTKHFITLTGEMILEENDRNTPPDISENFPEDLFENPAQPLLWLEVEYPAKFRQEILESMIISINAFPVANKYLYELTTEINDVLSVIPLRTGDYESLLGIHSITDSKGRIYYELPFDNTAEKQYMTYSLRRGGYESFNKRDAGEYLANLIGFLEKHSSIKAENNGENNNEAENALIQVHALIKHLRKVIERNKHQLEIQNYILIDSPEPDQVFFVKYWITNSERANQIKQQTSMLHLPSEDMVQLTDVYTLSATTGGKYPPDAPERQNLRLHLLSENSLLVTDDDIIGFCHSEFEHTISDAQIKKGLEYIPEQGFIQTTDVYLKPRDKAEYYFTGNRIEGFKQLLQKKSPATYYYRLFINNKQP